MKTRRKMLIVDDIETNREQLKSLFDEEFHIVMASDGAEAIAQIRKWNEEIALVLLDVIMPEMNGIEVLNWIRESEYKQIPVIAVTSDESYQLKALESGAWDFIAKPTDNSVIQARVHNVIGRYAFEREKKLAETLGFYDTLVNESDNGIYVNDAQTYELLHMNKTMLRLMGKMELDYAGKKCYEFLFGKTSPCEFCRMDVMSEDAFLERDFAYPFTNKIYCMRGKMSIWNGIRSHVEYIQDVTENRTISKENLRLKKQAEETLENYRTIVNTVPGAIALYEIEDDKIVTKYYSDGLCALSGYSREERDVYNQKDATALIYKDDVSYVLEEIKAAVEKKSNLDLIYRIQTKSGVPRCINLRATYVENPAGKVAFHAVFTDIDELKRLEEEKKEQQLRYEVALKSSGINVWEYDIVNDTLIVVSNSPRIKQNCFLIEHYIPSTIEKGYVREDSILDFYDIFKRLNAGEKEVKADIWYKTNDNLGFWCERVIYTSVFDEQGVPIKAFGAGRDVTREKEAEAKFMEEVGYREVIQNHKIAFAKLNLSKNLLVDAERDSRQPAQLPKVCTADLYFEKTCESVSGNENKTRYRNHFNRKRLLNKFSSGEYTESQKFTVIFEGNQVFWIEYSLHLIQNSENHDVIAYIISKDITEEMMMQTIMDTVTKMDYDYFVVVSGVTDSALEYAQDKKERQMDGTEPFEKKAEELVRLHVCAEDVERVVAACKIDAVMNQISDGTVYKLNYSIQEKDGSRRRKQLQFTLIDLERKAFLMSRIDVNDIYLEQKKVQEQLRSALETAKQASQVKSEFLSRMSHDMRTPMNGIIGLTNLSMNIPGLQDEMMKNLCAIEDSSKYLLSLINDVLDMSKIESNKIVLNPQVVHAGELINNTIAFVTPLAQEKGIAMKFVPIHVDLGYIRVDKMRLEQIFINILSNAIKFTPDGGKIQIEIEALKREGSMVDTRVSISDTGIGMTEEFLPKLFEPFVQEERNVSTNYTGTGLGMSIVKNLVDLMGGNIEVKSKLGQGTTVHVFIKFERIYDYEKIEERPKKKTKVSLQGKKILLCEDHPLNAQIAEKLLEGKGCIVTIARNGEEAVRMFQKSVERDFDAILMDIRMPVMDGLEACRKIRKLKREDAKEIPIIAMTANAFDEDVRMSKDAGMNAHLAKPIEPQKMFDTLSEYLNEEGGNER
ncbi:MAG: response regulator [Hespellia sp.]|nr:response regulator [Hespellia sp.]